MKRRANQINTVKKMPKGKSMALSMVRAAQYWKVWDCPSTVGFTVDYQIGRSW